MPEKPIDRLLDNIVLPPLPKPATLDDGIPYAPHEGVLRLGEVALKVYQLSDGRRVIDRDDFLGFFGFDHEVPRA